MLVYDAWPMSTLCLCNDICSSDRVCGSAQHYTGIGGESDCCYLYTLRSPLDFSRRATESLQQWEWMLYHTRHKVDKKSQVESASFLRLWGAASLYMTVLGHVAMEENRPTAALPWALHFLLNSLCTVAQEVLKFSGHFIHQSCKVCRRLYCHSMHQRRRISLLLRFIRPIKPTPVFLSRGQSRGDIESRRFRPKMYVLWFCYYSY